MAYATTTDVPVEKSRAEIERLLSKHQCTQFLAGVDHETHRATIQFKAQQRIIRFDMALPDPKDPKFKRIKGQYLQRTAQGIERAVAQEERTRWRSLLLVIKAKLEAIESGIATFEDEFLAHTVLPNQQTVAQYIAPQVAQMYSTGQMPPRQLTAAVEDV